MKFVLITQESHMQTVSGPSGFKYVSLKGIPFNVTDKSDIEHFKKNHRFKKLKKFEKSKVPTTPSVDDVFKEHLEAMKVSNETVELLVKTFETKQIFDEMMYTGTSLPENVSEEDRKIILDTYSQNQKSEPTIEETRLEEYNKLVSEGLSEEEARNKVWSENNESAEV